jgi:polar amino acid transport system ATP-binding protein
VRALAIEPEVLLLDEITSSLDPELVGEVLDVVRELKTSGMTLILATHEMGFARESSDVICVLDGGQLIEQGPPSQVLTNPTSERAQQFLDRIIRAGRL